jgi:tetratricopeptide (TPR) repeat protein
MIPVAPLLNEAFAAHQARRLADAQRLYKRVLKAAPNHPDALQLLGIVLLEQARWAEALPVLRRAVERAPTSATAHLNLGTAYAELGRTVEAIASCRTACRIQPALGDACSTGRGRVTRRARPSIAPSHSTRAIPAIATTARFASRRSAGSTWRRPTCARRCSSRRTLSTPG